MAEVTYATPESLIGTDWGGEESITKPEWRSITLGQNENIQQIAETALKASTLLTTNLEFAKAGINAAGILLKGSINPTIILLEAVADEIDNFMSDFRNIGFFMIDVGRPDVEYQLPYFFDDVDQDWKIVTMPLEAATIMVNMAAAAATGMTKEAIGWAAETIREDNIYLTGAQKTRYEIPIKERGYGTQWVDKCWSFQHETQEECEAAHAGFWIPVGNWKALDPSSKGPRPAPTNQIAEIDGWSGLPLLTPSKNIATIIAALDDKKDKRRPVLSTSAQTGAILIMVGVADFTKNLATIKDILQAIITFFGGEKQGVIAGVSKTFDLVNAALANLDDPAKESITLTVENVCEVIGNTEEQERWEEQKHIGYAGGNSVSSLWFEEEGEEDIFKPYNGKGSPRNHLFQEGDFVVGPRQQGPNGVGALGTISKVVQAENTTEVVLENQKTYVKYDGVTLRGTQTLEIQPLTPFDAAQFRNSKGHKLTKVSYFKDEWTVLGALSDVVFNTKNSFQWPEQLGEQFEDDIGEGKRFKTSREATIEGAKRSQTKASRPAGEQFCTVTTRENMTMEMSSLSGERQTYLTRITGDIVVKKEKGESAPPPNFTSVKLEDILGDFDAFFSAISGLTESMRKIASDMTKKIDEIIEYLDAKIAELEEINAALQAILKIFATGLPATGVYVLNIPVDIGGNEYIKKALQIGEGRPPDSLDFTMSLFMMMGGPSGKKLQELFIPED